MKLKKPAPSKAPSAAPTGGAAIADRFKLDAPAPGKGKGGGAAPHGTINKTAALVALIAGFVALAVAGILTWTLYQHWEYLMPA